MKELIEEFQVPQKVKNYRLGICDLCPFILKSDKGTTIKKDGYESLKDARCGDCGCFVNVKTGLKAWGCPQAKF